MKKLLQCLGLVGICVFLSACAAYVTPYPAGGTYCHYHPRRGVYRCHNYPYYHPYANPYRHSRRWYRRHSYWG